MVHHVAAVKKAVKKAAPKKVTAKKSAIKIVVPLPLKPTPAPQPGPAPVVAAMPTLVSQAPPLPSLPEPALSTSSFNVKNYIDYYQSVTGRQQLLQDAVKNRAFPDFLNQTQKDFLAKYGGASKSAWDNAILANQYVSQETSIFSASEKLRMNAPADVRVDATLYQKALTDYNGISNKGIIGTILQKVQDFSAVLTNLVKAFGAAASGVIKQLMDGLKNVTAAFFPTQLKDMNIQQGYVGDCYLLAGINALQKADPATQQLLKNDVTFNNDGSVNVSFPGYGIQDWDNRGNPVYKNFTVTPAALNWFEQNDRFGRSTTPLGVRAIEVAYGMNRAGLSSLNSPTDYNTAQAALWSGRLDEGIQALTGLNSNYLDGKTTSAATFNTYFNNPNAQAITAGTTSTPTSPLVASHAYTIIAYDPATNKVTAENPWYSTQPFQIDANAFDFYAVTQKS